MSTYLAAWAILPDNYGKQFDDDDEPFVSHLYFDIEYNRMRRMCSSRPGLDKVQQTRIKRD
jgi:hypothetical protein